MRRRRKIVCTLIAVCWFASGCTTQSYAPTTDAATREIKIKAGDEIRVVTTHRERLSFTVKEVRTDRFIGVTLKPQEKERRPAGETVEVPFNELAVLQVTRFSPKLATTIAVVTVTLFAAVMAVAVPPAAALAAP